MESLKIILLCILAAVGYGILHDQVTARVCVEYFTIGHPMLVPTTSPTLLGIMWGIVATWWVGLGLGIPLAVAACAGNRVKRPARSLVRPICWLLLAMGISAATAGTIGYLLASSGKVWLVGPMANMVPAEKRTHFLADLWAHSASYLVGLIGGLGILLQVWHSRRGLITPAGE